MGTLYHCASGGVDGGGTQPPPPAPFIRPHLQQSLGITSRRNPPGSRLLQAFVGMYSPYDADHEDYVQYVEADGRKELTNSTFIPASASQVWQGSWRLPSCAYVHAP
jgi:hypothetical protein